MERRVEELLERGVNALEKLAADEIEFQVETKPPVCPHCGTMNPIVRVEETANQGKLAEFFTQAHCLHCNNVFYVIPLQWEILKTVEQTREIIEEKLRVGGYTNGNDTRSDQGA